MSSTETRTTEPVQDAAARHFGDDYYGRPRFRKLLEYIPADGTILDFGCNEGVFLHLLRQHERRGLGIDRDPARVAACRRHGLDAIEADIFEFLEGVENQNEFAGILMADFVEHFDPRSLQDLLRRSVGVLRPGGVLAIFTPNSCSLAMATGSFWENEIEHHHTYSLTGLRRFLEQCGMEFRAGGPSPESRLRILTPHPLRLMRRLAYLGLARILCGRAAKYAEVFLVMQRPLARAARHTPARD